MDNIKNIIFDLGGVIITLDPQEALRRFLEIGVENPHEYLNSYHQKGIFLQLEEGKLSLNEFCDALREQTGKNMTNEDIDYGWLGFLKEIPEYKLDMLEKLREKYNLYLLSNTNPVIMTWARSDDFPGKGKILDDYFDKLYLSCEIGITKPDRAIFEHLIADAAIDPSETLFIDDGKANVEMAKSLGMTIYQPQNGEDFRSIFWTLN